MRMRKISEPTPRCANAPPPIAGMRVNTSLKRYYYPTQFIYAAQLGMGGNFSVASDPHYLHTRLLSRSDGDEALATPTALSHSPLDCLAPFLSGGIADKQRGVGSGSFAVVKEYEVLGNRRVLFASASQHIALSGRVRRGGLAATVSRRGVPRHDPAEKWSARGSSLLQHSLRRGVRFALNSPGVACPLFTAICLPITKCWTLAPPRIAGPGPGYTLCYMLPESLVEKPKL